MSLDVCPLPYPSPASGGGNASGTTVIQQATLIPPPDIRIV